MNFSLKININPEQTFRANNKLAKIIDKRRNKQKQYKTMMLANPFKQRQNQHMNTLLKSKKQSESDTFVREQNINFELNIEGKEQKLMSPQLSLVQNKRIHPLLLKKNNQKSKLVKGYQQKRCKQKDDVRIDSWYNENYYDQNCEQENDLLEYQTKINHSSEKNKQGQEIAQRVQQQQKKYKRNLCITSRVFKKQGNNMYPTSVNAKYYSNVSLKRQSLSNIYHSNLINPTQINIFNGVFSKNSDNQQQNSLRVNYENKRVLTNKNQCQKGYQKYHSSLDKCRVMTQSYDELKQQIITKIKLKRTTCRSQSSEHFFPIHNYKKKYRIGSKLVKQKENKFSKDRNYQTTHKAWRQGFQKMTRYADISVEQFLDQQKASIDCQLVKKIEQMKKQYVRPRSKTQ